MGEKKCHVECHDSLRKDSLCDQTTLEQCIIWCKMQTAPKTEQAPISVAKPFLLCQKSHAHVQGLNVLRTLPVLSSGPLLSNDCVFYCMSSRYFICQILFQHDRHDITSVSDITSTCWTTMRKHSTWQVIKNVKPWRNVHLRWLNVCLFYLFISLL